MTLRPARSEDVTAVAALEAELFGLDAWSADAVHEELTGGRRRAVVACDGGLVGYAVTLCSGDVVDLQRIAVAPSRRRAGIASRLLAAVRATALAEGSQQMLLEVSADNDGALAFYAREGFVEIDRRQRYYRDGSDALVLRAPLAATAHQGRVS